MGRAHSQEKRSLSARDIADAMMQFDGEKIEALCRLLRHHPQLVLGHFSMRFVLEPRDRRPILQWPDVAKKIDNGAGVRCIKWRIERKRSIDQGDFAKGICHALYLLVYCHADLSARNKTRYAKS